ncbi:MAG: hypothetical protein AAF740_11295 [Bacteroidota bacterium]
MITIIGILATEALIADEGAISSMTSVFVSLLLIIGAPFWIYSLVVYFLRGDRARLSPVINGICFLLLCSFIVGIKGKEVSPNEIRDRLFGIPSKLKAGYGDDEFFYQFDFKKDFQYTFFKARKGRDNYHYGRYSLQEDTIRLHFNPEPDVLTGYFLIVRDSIGRDDIYKLVQLDERKRRVDAIELRISYFTNSRIEPVDSIASQDSPNQF